MNTLNDLFSPAELLQYEQTLYPFNLSILHSALKQKLELEPDYEVFVPLVYYKYSGLVKNNTFSALTPYKLFISNKGRVISLRDKEPRELSLFQTHGYATVALPKPKGHSFNAQVHRILGCCFIPVEEEFSGTHPRDLVINHVDGIKLNIALDNLEWCTTLHNNRHGIDTGLVVMASGVARKDTKAVRGTVLVGEFKGHQFVLAGAKEYSAHGFRQSSISRCCLGARGSYKNCSWSFATEEELALLPRTITEEIRKSLTPRRSNH